MKINFARPDIVLDILGEQLLMAYAFAQNCFSLESRYPCAGLSPKGD